MPDPVADHLLDGLDDDQRLAVVTDDLPLAVLAPAGSGKTRVLTRRIAWRVATGRDDPRRVLAVTFTRAAAGQLRSRLRALGVPGDPHCGTLHHIARHELARWSTDHGTAAPTVAADTTELVKAAAGDDRTAADLRTELAWARARLVPAERYEEEAARAGRRTAARAERLAAAMASYAALKRQRRVLDFDDLLEQAIARLEEDGPWRSGRQWFYGCPYVDEFQDVSPLQVRFLQRLLGDGARLCVVGDPNQAIYGFNGADARFLRRFADHFPGGTTVRLRRSYRSTAGIATAATRALIAANQEVVLEPARDRGLAPTITRCEDEAAEAAAVARAVVDRHLPGRPWSSQGVLVRTRAQLEPIRLALEAHRIPYRMAAADAPEDPARRRALGMLRRSTLPYRDALARLAADLDRMVPADGEDDDEGEAVRAVLAAADDYERAGGAPSIAGLLGWLALVGLAPPAKDAVDLATFHAAKGLEWTVVHLAGAEEGLVPSSWATTPEAEMEERRLFYVACTRAADELHVTWAAARSVGGRVRARRRSRFLDDLAQALADDERLHRPRDGRPDIDAIRERLGASRSRMPP